jgi:hypothetical protein
VWVFLVFVLLAGWAGQRPAASQPAAEVHVTENSAFRVEVPADREELGSALLNWATRARLVVGEHSDVALPFQVTVKWCETEEEFFGHTGQRPESVVAAASARQALIWINGPAWRRAGVEQSLSILIHEYAHVVVGRMSPVRLPRWTNEGLVMHLAGQWTLGDGLAASRAQLFGGLPDLASIDQGFPDDPETMRRAYLMSYLAVDHLARSLGARPGNVDPILDRIRDPVNGRAFVASLWEPEIREGIEARVRAALGNSVKKWIIYLSSGTSLWLIIVALFLYAYWRKRREKERAAEQERREEPWVESLTETDIREIYGEPQDVYEEENERPWE